MTRGRSRAAVRSGRCARDKRTAWKCRAMWRSPRRRKAGIDSGAISALTGGCDDGGKALDDLTAGSPLALAACRSGARTTTSACAQAAATGGRCHRAPAGPPAPIELTPHRSVARPPNRRGVIIHPTDPDLHVILTTGLVVGSALAVGSLLSPGENKKPQPHML